MNCWKLHEKESAPAHHPLHHPLCLQGRLAAHQRAIENIAYGTQIA
jgi:hypothetical protein